MKTLEIYELGSEVVVDKEIPAVITGVNIRSAENSVRVSYEVTWWEERTRKSEWLEPFEIKAKSTKRATLSFVKSA